MIATSTTNAQSDIGGSLVHSGDSLTGVMHVDATCYDIRSDVPFSGSLQGSDFTITSGSVDSQVVTFRGTAQGDTLSGTYSISGGCANGDSGTIRGVHVPSITGTWKGTDQNGQAFTVNVQQQSSANSDGVFPLSGTVSASPTSCYPGGTLNLIPFTSGASVLSYSTIFGNMVEFAAATSNGEAWIFAGYINNPDRATMMSGMQMSTSAACTTPVTIDLTKQ